MAGINHTYESAVSVFPDGRVVPMDSVRIQPVLGPFDGVPEHTHQKRAEVAERQASDIEFVAAQLETLNRSADPLADRMDLDRLAAFGHSGRKRGVGVRSGKPALPGCGKSRWGHLERHRSNGPRTTDDEDPGRPRGNGHAMPGHCQDGRLSICGMVRGGAGAHHRRVADRLRAWRAGVWIIGTRQRAYQLHGSSIPISGAWI